MRKLALVFTIVSVVSLAAVVPAMADTFRSDIFLASSTDVGSYGDSSMDYQHEEIDIYNELDESGYERNNGSASCPYTTYCSTSVIYYNGYVPNTLYESKSSYTIKDGFDYTFDNSSDNNLFN